MKRLAPVLFVVAAAFAVVRNPMPGWMAPASASGGGGGSDSSFVSATADTFTSSRANPDAKMFRSGTRRMTLQDTLLLVRLRGTEVLATRATVDTVTVSSLLNVSTINGGVKTFNATTTMRPRNDSLAMAIYGGNGGPRTNGAGIEIFGNNSSQPGTMNYWLGRTTTSGHQFYDTTGAVSMRLNPAGRLSVSSSSGDATFTLNANNAGTVDAAHIFQKAGTNQYAMGLDWSDGARFKLSRGGALGSNDVFIANSADNNFLFTSLAGTGTRLVTSNASGTLGNATTVAGSYTFSDTVTARGVIINGNGSSTSLIANNLGTNGDLTIRTNTADGSDNANLFLTGGGATGSTGARGAQINLYGNEATNGGSLYSRLGNVAGAAFNVYRGNNTLAFQVDGAAGKATFSGDSVIATGSAAVTGTVTSGGFISTPSISANSGYAVSPAYSMMATTSNFSDGFGTVLFTPRRNATTPFVFSNGYTGADTGFMLKIRPVSAGETRLQFGSRMIETGIINVSSTNFYVGGQAAKTMSLGSNANEVIRLSADERVGIGTTSPSTRLHVAGRATFDSAVAISGASGLGNLHVLSTTSANQSAIFERANPGAANATWVAGRFLATRDSAMGAGFGVEMFLQGRGPTGGARTFSAIRGTRQTNDSSGGFQLQTFLNGVGTTRYAVSDSGRHSFTGPISAQRATFDSVVTANNGIEVTGGTSAQGRIFKTAADGLRIRGVTGSINDLQITSAANNSIIENPTGTNSVLLGRSATGGSGGFVGVGLSTATPINTDALMEIEAAATAALSLVGHGGSNGGAIVGYNTGGTKASPTATSDNAPLLGLRGRGYGTSYTTNSSASYLMNADGLWSGSNNGSYHSWLGTPNASTTAAEWMRLYRGNLGIGTTSPSQKLHVAGRATFDSAVTALGLSVGTGNASFNSNITSVGNITSSSGTWQTGGSMQALRFGSGTTPSTTSLMSLISGAGTTLGATQRTILTQNTFNSAASTAAVGVDIADGSLAASFTTPLVAGVRVQTYNRGAGNSITEWNGVRIEPGPTASNLYAIRTVGTSDSVRFAGPLRAAGGVAGGLSVISGNINQNGVARTGGPFAGASGYSNGGTERQMNPTLRYAGTGLSYRLDTLLTTNFASGAYQQATINWVADYGSDTLVLSNTSSGTNIWTGSSVTVLRSEASSNTITVRNTNSADFDVPGVGVINASTGITFPYTPGATTYSCATFTWDGTYWATQLSCASN